MAAPAQAQTAVLTLPDPVATPGAVDPSVSLADICTGTTKKRRHVSPATRARVLAYYGETKRYAVGELDHLIPLAIGGANTAENLWPQSYPDYAIKDRLENVLQRRACVAYRTFTPEDAAKVLAEEQRDVAEDWIAAYRKYVGAMP